MHPINPDQKINYTELVKIPDTDSEFFKVTHFSVIKLLVFWAIWLNQIRLACGFPITILSAFRTVAYELSKGRQGGSQHTFQPGKNFGAADIRISTTGLSFAVHNLRQKVLFEALMNHPLPPRRIAFYPNSKDKYSWFHIDFHPDVDKDKTQLFFGKEDGSWQLFDGRLEDYINHIERKTRP